MVEEEPPEVPNSPGSLFMESVFYVFVCFMCLEGRLEHFLEDLSR